MAFLISIKAKTHEHTIEISLRSLNQNWHHSPPFSWMG